MRPLHGPDDMECGWFDEARHSQSVGDVYRDGDVDSGHRSTPVLDEAGLDWNRAEMSSACAHSRGQRPIPTMERRVAVVSDSFVLAGAS